MKFFKNRINLIITGLVLVVLVGAGIFYFQNSSSAEATAPALQTAKVRTGDLVITASGAGTVLPAAQVDLGFRSAGIVSEVSVANGDSVTAAQILARLEDNLQAEADFQALFSAQGLTQAELAVANAEDALDDAVNAVIYFVGSNSWYWENKANEAQAALNALDASATASQKESAQKTVDDARARAEYFMKLNIAELEKDNVIVTDAGIALSRANLETARVNLLDAQTALEIIKAGPEALNQPITALGVETARLEQARLDLENTRLVAPFDGSVVSMNLVNGQTVGTSPVMTIVTTDDLLVRFYLDETDIDKAAPGMKVNFTFDAYSDTPITGEIKLVEPALQVIDGTPVVVVWASLPNDAPFKIISGMTVEAEVIAAEAQDALIVPLQALRELTPGSYAVFIVAPDGQLKMTPVTVGLRDYANAQILSGVNVGDVVSTGTVETK